MIISFSSIATALKFAATVAEHGIPAAERIIEACGASEITDEMWDEQVERWAKTPDDYLREAEERSKK